MGKAGQFFKNMETINWENNQGLHLFAAHWPHVTPRAVIALVHGQGEHTGRYRHVAAWFQQHGIAVIGMDHQGHGKSAGKKGHADNLAVLLDDIEQFLAMVRAKYPDSPLFLYGHSMGGHLALNLVLRRRPALAGLIVTGPWIKLAFEPAFLKVLVGKLLRKFMPNLTLPTGLIVRYISRDPAVVQAYQDDPLVHGQVSAAAGIALMEGAQWLNQYEGPAPVPVLMMHGGADSITSAAATKALASRLSGDVTHREWPELFHEIHNEPEKEAVFAAILAWMEGRIP